MDILVENLIAKVQRIRTREYSSPQEIQSAIRNWLADEVTPMVSQFAGDDRFVMAANWPFKLPMDNSINSFRVSIREICNSLADLADQTLANPNDYWAFKESSSLTGMNPLGVTTLGDRVTRRFVAHLDLCITELSGRLGHVYPTQHRTARTQIAARITEAKSKATQIRQRCTSKLNGFGEACVVLTQVYAGFARHVDLHWIPKVISTPQSQGDLLVQSILEPSVDLDALDRVVWALSTVAKELEQLPDPEVAIQNAVSCFDLVIDLSAKTFYWKGEQFLAKLSPSSWELFSVLAEARKHWNRPVDAFDVGDNGGTYQNLKVQKQRLVKALRKQFPDLADSVVPKEKTYLLSIERKTIAIFTRVVTERVYQLCGLVQTNPRSVDVKRTQT